LDVDCWAGQERDEEDQRVQGTTRWILHVIKLATQTTGVSGVVESRRSRKSRAGPVLVAGVRLDETGGVTQPGSSLGAVIDPFAQSLRSLHASLHPITIQAEQGAQVAQV
jgi:hypothetical protein